MTPKCLVEAMRLLRHCLPRNDASTAVTRAAGFKKASLAAFPLPIVEGELRPIPAKGWAEMIRKVFEVNPLTCPKCQGKMRIIAFITDYAVVDRIINHLNVTFVAERPPPPHVVSQEFFSDSEASADYFS